MSNVQTTQTTAVVPAAQKELSPMGRIQESFANPLVQEKLSASLDGLGVSPQRYLRAAMSALAGSTYLVEKCSTMSIVSAVLRAATMRLELDPALGQAYLVPRSGQATLQVSAKGYIELARRTGRLLAIDMGDICENDQVRYVRGTNPVLEVSPPIGKPRGTVLAYYCAAQWKDGGCTVEVMSVEAIEAHRNAYSEDWKRQGVKSIWGKHFAEMAKKTVLLRARKSWPVSIAEDGVEGDYIDADFEQQDAAPQQLVAHDPETGEIRDQPVQQQQGRSSRLTKFVGSRAA